MKAATPARRSRSNDGCPNHTEAVLPISRDDLRRLLIIFTSEPPKRAAPRTFHGPRPTTGHGPVRFTDEQVLVIRKMRDWHGMSCAQIAKVLGATASQIEPIAGWRNRVHLDPGPRPIPQSA